VLLCAGNPAVIYLQRKPPTGGVCHLKIGLNVLDDDVHFAFPLAKLHHWERGQRAFFHAKNKRR
jgi:hypothetical protein